MGSSKIYGGSIVARHQREHDGDHLIVATTKIHNLTQVNSNRVDPSQNSSTQFDGYRLRGYGSNAQNYDGAPEARSSRKTPHFRNTSLGCCNNSDIGRGANNSGISAGVPTRKDISAQLRDNCAPLRRQATGAVVTYTKQHGDVRSQSSGEL